jgi:nucleotide-binding universal stress UspA family protein
VFRHVLCAYDGSAAAEAALDEAIDLAEAMRARLAIVSVIEKPPPGVAAAGVDPQALAQTIEHEAADRLRAAADRVPDDVPLTTMLRIGHAGKQILKAAEEVRADVLVLGTRGRGRMTANVFGSVAADVHYHTRLPMLVVSRRDEQE